MAGMAREQRELMPKMKSVVFCLSIADMTHLKYGTDINMLCCTHKPTMLDFLDRAAQAQLGRRHEGSGEGGCRRFGRQLRKSTATVLRDSLS